MANIKQPSDRKRNHHNFYLTDSDEKILDKIMSKHSDMTLDRMVMYSLKKIYNNTNYPNDYNAILITFLSERQSIIKEEIKRLRSMLDDKVKDLQNVEDLINEVMRGENDRGTTE